MIGQHGTIWSTCVAIQTKTSLQSLFKLVIKNERSEVELFEWSCFVLRCLPTLLTLLLSIIYTHKSSLFGWSIISKLLAEVSATNCEQNSRFLIWCLMHDQMHLPVLPVLSCLLRDLIFTITLESWVTYSECVIFCNHTYVNWNPQYVMLPPCHTILGPSCTQISNLFFFHTPINWIPQ